MEKHSFVTQRNNVAEVRSRDGGPDQDDPVEQRISEE
jgi:hypothetical protein